MEKGRRQLHAVPALGTLFLTIPRFEHTRAGAAGLLQQRFWKPDAGGACRIQSWGAVSQRPLTSKFILGQGSPVSHRRPTAPRGQ